MQLDCNDCGTLLYSSGSGDGHTGVVCRCGGNTEVRGLAIVCSDCGNACVEFECCARRVSPHLAQEFLDRFA